MRNLLNASGVVLFFGFLSGCSSFLGLGEEEFGCTGLPTGVKCLSALEVHKATDYKDYVSDEDVEFFNPPVQKKEVEGQVTSGEPRRRRFGEEAIQVFREDAYIPPHVRSAAPMPDSSIPIRTRPKILRIWIAPWEDEEGFLNTAGYTYKEVVPRQWAIGEPYRGSKYKQLKSIVQDKPEPRTSGTHGVGASAPQKNSRGKLP